MRVTRYTLLALIALFPALISFATNPFPAGNEAARAQGAQLRIVLPIISRDVLADVVIESITVTRSEVDEASFRYRIRNIGDAPAELSRFTMQAWFSPSAALDKATALEAGIAGFGITLQPGAVLEAEAEASAPQGSISTYPYLVLELDSAGAVTESNAANNTTATLRPPLDLLTNVQLRWDDESDTAIITWVFAGTVYGIADEGFRVEVPGFGTQEVSPGTRTLIVPFNPLSGARPCIARVTPLRAGAAPWPTVESNRLCQ